ncbi:hypothetical protein PTKIN_Ptkin06aG0181800 [Pterospermum kingtungense]
MAILNRFPTKDRLLKWEMQVSDHCLLCHNLVDTRDHLFFGCNFSRKIWQSVLLLCNLRRDVLSWNEELHWASKKLKGKSLLSTILRWAWLAFIYFIWKERSFKLHRQVEHSEGHIVDEIKQMIQVKVSDFIKIKKDSINCSLVHAWNIVHHSFV